MTSLSELICKTFEIDKSSDQFKDIYGYTCKYLIGAVSAFDYQHKMKKIVDFTLYDFSAKEFRLTVLELGRYTLNLKLFLYYIIKTAKTPKQFKSNKEFIESVCKDARVQPVDAIQAYMILKPEFAKLRRAKSVSSLPKDLVNPNKLLHWHLKFNNVVYKSVMKTIKQITYTKLRFISNSTNIGLSDLHSELMIKALLSYYRLVPTKCSDAHIINYIRRSVSNQSKNMIKTYTSKKRGRFINIGDDGFGGSNFDLIVMSENQLRGNEDNKDLSYDQLGTTNVNSINSVESKLSIKALRVRYKPMPKKYTALRLVLGDEHEGFTKFLRSKGLLRKGTNSDYQDRCSPDKYTLLIAEFLNVKVEKLNRFLRAVEFHYLAENKVSEYADCG